MKTKISNELAILIGNKIRHRRLELNLKQRDLEEMFFMSKTAISQLENGKCEPTMWDCIRYFEVLNMDLHEFLDEVSERHDISKISENRKSIENLSAEVEFLRHKLNVLELKMGQMNKINS